MDISQGGVSFITKEFIPKQTLLDLKLTLENSGLFIEASARVSWVIKKVHSDKYEVGVEFINVSKKSMGYLIDYISSSLKS